MERRPRWWFLDSRLELAGKRKGKNVRIRGRGKKQESESERESEKLERRERGRVGNERVGE